MIKTKRNLSIKTGFTLIELLVVISIIGLLATIVTISLNSARAKARDTKRVAELRSIMNAFELYFDSYGQYPCGYQISPALNTCYDASFLNNFLDGFQDKTGTPRPGAVSGCRNGGSPYYGLISEGLLSSASISDILGLSGVAGGHAFFYEVQFDPLSGKRDKYIIYTRMETFSYGKSDGGMCDNFYEIGSGVGFMTPQILVGAPCN
jgi:prepilin-type N-terminal cleavage/methylation domain-containing protein